jgi:LysM repeat protein
MLFVSPVEGHNDFHWYKQHSVVTYKVKTGDTQTSIAKYFKVPVSRIKGALTADGLVPGRTIKFKSNLWSHKRGWGNGPLLTDSKGKVIFNPLTANKNYGGLNYKSFCHAFCVQMRGVKVGKTGP